ncbi:MAG: hypothetical protein V3W44_09565 [Dehalococcoidales bacterium]
MYVGPVQVKLVEVGDPGETDPAFGLGLHAIYRGHRSPFDSIAYGGGAKAWFDSIVADQPNKDDAFNASLAESAIEKLNALDPPPTP